MTPEQWDSLKKKDPRYNRPEFGEAVRAGIVRYTEASTEPASLASSVPELKVCRHLGKRIPGEPCGSPLMRCDLFGEITSRFYPCDKATRCCNGCEKKEIKIPFEAKAEDPRVGIVLGCFRWPALADLQCRVIRETCGRVPILLSNDRPEDHAELAAVVSNHADVTLDTNPERIGHTGGDIAAFSKGIKWAAGRGIEILGKLSQRFVVNRPRWLQDSAADLLASGLPMASRRCLGPKPYDLRTEAVLIDVGRWNRPEVLERIRPRQYWTDEAGGLPAETVLHRVLTDFLGGIYWPWVSVMGEDRSKRERSDVLWHWDTPADEYHRLASAHGVALPMAFHVGGWERELKAGTYEFG